MLAVATKSPVPPVLSPIRTADLGAVGIFLHQRLGARLSAAEWAAATRTPWPTDVRDHGYQLRVGERIVGVHLAFHSTRQVEGRSVHVCNLGAWCVDEAYRAQGLRLLRALLDQRTSQHEVTFTDLSPSGHVVGLAERLGFARVDTPTSLVPALPWPAPPGTQVSSDPAYLARVLRGRQREIYDDHRGAAAALHLVVTQGDRSCYVVLRRDTRRGVRGFATVLYASDPDLLGAAIRPVASHLLTRYAVAALLVEDRFVGGHRPRGSAVVRRLQRPRMVRGPAVPDGTEYLYSELTCVAW